VSSGHSPCREPLRRGLLNHLIKPENRISLAMGIQ